MAEGKAPLDEWLDDDPEGLKVAEDLGIAWESLDDAFKADDLAEIDSSASEAIRALRRVVSAVRREQLRRNTTNPPTVKD